MVQNNYKSYNKIKNFIKIPKLIQFYNIYYFLCLL